MSVISIYVSVICDMYVIKGLKSAVIIHFTVKDQSCRRRVPLHVILLRNGRHHQRWVTFMRVFFSRSALYVSVGRYVCPLYVYVIYIYGAECIYGAEQAIW